LPRNVDDRFGGQTRHRGASDLLNIEGMPAQRRQQIFALGSKPCSPLFLVRDHPDMVAPQSDHRLSPLLFAVL
jgi:hypothetical protein